MQHCFILAIVGGFIGLGASLYFFDRAQGFDPGLSQLGRAVCLATGAILGAIFGAVNDITMALTTTGEPKIGAESRPLPRWSWVVFVAVVLLAIFALYRLRTLPGK